MRTFPKDLEFQSNVDIFERVVNVFCTQLPKEVGYLQGMNFVCGAILRAFNYREELAFWCLIQLFNRQNLLQLYDLSTNKYKTLSYQTEALLKEIHPVLSEHLLKLDFDFSIYSVKWFLSLFCIDLPESFVFQMLDFYQYEQSAIFVRVAITMLFLLAPFILNANSNEELH